jgi:hypothetical protein
VSEVNLPLRRSISVSASSIHMPRRLPTGDGSVSAFFFERDDRGEFVFIGDALAVHELTKGPSAGQRRTVCRAAEPASEKTEPVV